MFNKNLALKIILATIVTIIFFLTGFCIPIFWNWYKETFNIFGDELIALCLMIIGFMVFQGLVVVYLWGKVAEKK